MTPDLYQHVESAMQISFAFGFGLAFAIQLPFILFAWFEERFVNDR